MKSKFSRKRTWLAIGLGTVLFGITGYPAVSALIATGDIPYSNVIGGPATVTVRQLTIAPGEVLGWHYHPGYVLTIVKEGTLTVEDGCGGEEVYAAGEAFEEIPGRVHRGKNLGTEEVRTIQTFILPPGTPISITVTDSQALCGPPASKDECKDGGWMSFSHPRSFSSQGDCEQYVNTGR